MEAARTSKTSADIQLRTRQYIPEDSRLHTRRRENLKSHIINISHHVILNLSWWPKAPQTIKHAVTEPGFAVSNTTACSRSQWQRDPTLRPWLLGRWDRGLESRLRYECLSSSVNHSNSLSAYHLSSEKAS
jgi:hypothetical protein